MATSNTIPDELLPRLKQAAEEQNTTAEEFAAEAIEKHLARKALDRLSRDAVKARGNMTDEQVEEYVDKVIHEFRAENRGR